VDMVSIVGAECGGHPGMDMIGSFVNAAMAGRDLDIPFLIGGGVGHGSQLVAALAMGADGVVMGTAMRWGSPTGLSRWPISSHASRRRRLMPLAG